MKVLFINTYENKGGASIAAKRLMKALKKRDIEVSMLVLNKTTNDPDVYALNDSFIKKKINFLRFLWERLVIYCQNGLNKKSLFQVSIANTGTDIHRHPLVKQADILHLHWTNHGFLSNKDIKKLTLISKPIIWTMHDMWVCTGICHYSYTCDKFKDKCGKCPFLHSNNKNDLSFKGWENKQFISESQIRLVTVSNWLADKVKTSLLTRSLPCTVIPNVINLSIFRKGDKVDIRKKLSLPLKNKLILMGAARLDDPIKGLDYLINAIKHLMKNNTYADQIGIILFGDIKDKDVLKDLLIPYFYMGMLNDPYKISHLYMAADVTVTPSLYETFGQTIIESMACGCPVVSFNNSGQTDIIDHKLNGYLAEYKNSKDLASGIEWALQNGHEEKIITACIQKVNNNYSEEIISQRYVSLYKQMINS